jgi:hypothetical protein
VGAVERELNFGGCRGAVQVHVCLISLTQASRAPVEGSRGWEGVERTEHVGALSARRSEGWNLCLVGISTAKAPPVELRHYAADRLGMHRTTVGD